MKIVDAAFVTSVPAEGRLPGDLGPTIAMVGRSNVGKSSLINALVSRRIARAGAKPGTTRLVNLYAVRAAAGARRPLRLTFADLPGYGFARGGARTRDEFRAITDAFFRQIDAPVHPTGGPGPRRRLAATLLVVDGRHPGLENDVAAATWLRERDLPTVLVTTKNDRMNARDRTRTRVEHERALGGPVLVTSSKTGEGVPAVWMAVEALL